MYSVNKINIKETKIMMVYENIMINNKKNSRKRDSNGKYTKMQLKHVKNVTKPRV